MENKPAQGTGYESQWNEVYGLDKDPVRKYLIFPLIHEHSRDLSGKSVLDAGCGNGNLIHTLAKANFTKAVGIDRSTAFIESAREHLSDERVSFVESDLLEKLPFDSGSFDVVYSVFVLNELPRIDVHLHELSRVLHSNGELIIIATHPFFAMQQHLYERFTGEPNKKLIGVKGYFDDGPIQYVFTLANATATFFQHTFEQFLNPLSVSGLQLVEIRELRTDNPNFESIPSYWNTRDDPKFLFIKARKC